MLPRVLAGSSVGSIGGWGGWGGVGWVGHVLLPAGRGGSAAMAINEVNGGSPV